MTLTGRGGPEPRTPVIVGAAQAQCEGLTLVTRHSRGQQYDIAVLPV